MIRTEEIYDAATDDAAFDRLAARLADAVGARSAVLHWGHGPAHVAEVSYSGYFSGEQMALYDEEFLNDDLWGEALEGLAPNRVWDVEALVPDSAYEGSRIYNEWIRPMGDDTFRCLGGIVQHGDTIGHVGLHRGRTQPSFDDRQRALVQDSVGHIGRMFDIRRKLDRASGQGKSLRATLDLVDHAVFLLTAQGTLLEGNRAAEAMLRRQDALMLRHRHIAARHVQDDAALQAALRAAGDRQSTQATACLLQRVGGLPLAVSVAAIWSGDQRQIVLIVTDPQAGDPGLAARVRALYGLTRAEAEVVVGLSEGKPLEQVSEERGVALATVRTQMKTIYLKMDCSRQSELVARVARLPRLNAPD